MKINQLLLTAFGFLLLIGYAVFSQQDMMFVFIALVSTYIFGLQDGTYGSWKQ